MPQKSKYKKIVQNSTKLMYKKTLRKLSATHIYLHVIRKYLFTLEDKYKYALDSWKLHIFSTKLILTIKSSK